MNVQDIVTRVRRVFGDEAAVQISNDDIMRWINDAQIEIVKSNETALETTGFLNLVATQSTYTLPADLLTLRTVRYKYSSMQSYSALKYKNMQEMDDSIDGWDGDAFNDNNPIYFTLYDNNLLLFPTPDQSVISGLKLLYNRKPTDVTMLSDDLSLPLKYANTIYKYCMWQASHLDEDLEPVQLYKSYFNEDLQTLQNNEIQEPTNTYPVITVLEWDQ